MPPRSRLRIDFPLVESVRDRLARDRLELERFRPPIKTLATTHEVLRPDDLLHFHVGLAHMTRGAGGRWFPSAGAPVGLLTFHFQPQHMCRGAR